MNIYRASTADTAIKIPATIGESHKSDKIIEQYIEQMFGGLNGDYFIMNTQIRTDIKGRTFKILLVEDKDEEKHTLYFQLIYP